MVKCDLTHNIIVFLKRAKVNSFKEFFSKNQKAFNSEIKTSTSRMGLTPKSENLIKTP